MKGSVGQLAIFDDLHAGPARLVDLTPGCLLPHQETEVIDLQRAAAILGVSKISAIEYMRADLFRGYRIADAFPWSIYYDSIIELCDRLRIRFVIRDRRPRLEGSSRRWRDRELLPFPLDDTITVKEAASAFSIHPNKMNNLIIDRAAGEPGAFDAYRFLDRSPWRISRSSLIRYADQRRLKSVP